MSSATFRPYVIPSSNYLQTVDLFCESSIEALRIHSLQIYSHDGEVEERRRDPLLVILGVTVAPAAFRSSRNSFLFVPVPFAELPFTSTDRM